MSVHLMPLPGAAGEGGIGFLSGRGPVVADVATGPGWYGRPVDVVGYVQCKCGCGRLELAHVAHQTHGYAFGCWLERQARPPAVRVGLKDVPIRPRRRTKPKHRGSAKTQRLTDSARDKAMRRLKNNHLDEYQLLYDEERAKAGLVPVVRASQYGIETYRDAAAYHAAATPGVVDEHLWPQAARTQHRQQ